MTEPEPCVQCGGVVPIDDSAPVPMHCSQACIDAFDEANPGYWQPIENAAEFVRMFQDAAAAIKRRN